ncbi:DUF2797 domain-containing protein [Nocardiopsis alkaliphila]|uniref:DUF2797 domain-containing protein n=1 Tax=Nocardiopsis alkaliphila TaxID=225762 RepID=UPI000476F6B8|nr:DUF2797 domain-containing protein [Nocardiopsis alkaliphila]
MNPTAPVTLLGLDWNDSENPRLLTTDPDHPERSLLHPLLGEHTFRVDGEQRRCVGWFELTGAQGRHVRCRTDEIVTRGKQCRRCQYKEGFIAAHQAHRTPDALPDNIRDYLQQPHWLYLDVFANGTTKVGTAADSRRRSRLNEQGPVAALYLARTKDGATVRTLESALSQHFSLPQQVQARRKVLGLQNSIDTTALITKLTELAAQVTPYLDKFAAEQPGTEVLAAPEPWLRPACSTAVFESAPVLAYPGDLTQGTHRLHITGAAGPVVVFSTDPEPDVPHHCADLSKLIGRTLAPVTAEDAPTGAPTLF